MKNLVHPKYLPVIATFSGLLGFLLRLWTMDGGPDIQGLYKANPVAWFLIWVVSIVALGAIWLASSRLTEPGDYADNFPASPFAAVGCGLAALGIATTAVPLVMAGATWLETVAGVVGLVAAVAMVLVAWARWNGKVPNFLFHFSVCLYFALRIFDRCKAWSNEPQLAVFLFPFLACVCVMLAAYQLSCFDVNLPKRKACLFWSLSGVYFSIVAMAGSEELLFHGCMAIWLMTHLCSLKPMKKKEDTPSAEEGIDPPPVCE